MTQRAPAAALLLLACLAGAIPARAAGPIVCPDAEAARQGNMLDAFYMGEAHRHGYCGIAADRAEALRWYGAAAQQGHTLAAHALGEAHFTGDGGTPDYPQAKKWYLQAAGQGHGPSALRLGFLYAEAHFAGLTPDLAEAEKWFTVAAEQDAGDARFRLGNFYANYKRPPDHDRAFVWMRQAAEGGHRVAMFDLARMYLDARGAARDEAAALRWMTKAAEAGLQEAQMALSDMYASGEGAPKNPAESLKWTMRVAAPVTASAAWLNRAGDIFFTGWEGIPANYPAALKYYERAARKGDPHARARLGRMYAEGLGVEKDAEKAAEYLK